MLKCKGLFAVSLPSHSPLVMAARLAPKTLPGDQKSGKSLDKTPIRKLCGISPHPEPQALAPRDPHKPLAGVSSLPAPCGQLPCPHLNTELIQTVKWVCRFQIRDPLENS